MAIGYTPEWRDQISTEWQSGESLTGKCKSAQVAIGCMPEWQLGESPTGEHNLYGWQSGAHLNSEPKYILNGNQSGEPKRQA